MARGDPVYAKIDVAIWTSAKFTALSNDDRLLYLGLWMLAVEFRSDVLPAQLMSCAYAAHRLRMSSRYVKSGLARVQRIGLIDIDDKKNITIYRVKECHKALSWDRCPKRGPNGEYVFPYLGDIRESESPRDPESGMSSYNSTDPDSENVTQKEQPAPPGPAGAVDVKKLLEEAEKESDRKRAAAPGGPGDVEEIDEPWNQVKPEAELDREVHLWFLELWPHGEYDWDAEQASLLSQVRKYGRGAYNVARVALLEARKRGEWIENELAWMNKVARETAQG